MLKLGVLVSGGGTNLQAIIDSIENGQNKGLVEIVTVISNKEGAYALQRAKNHGIHGICINSKSFPNNADYEKEVLKELKKRQVELIVLAGYMKILSPEFIKEYEGNIINIHPALIPKHCGEGYYGLKVHESVLASGDKVTGATVHYVIPKVDAGEIIIQKEIPVEKGDTPEVLQKRVMEQVEWKIYPQAIHDIAVRRDRNKGGSLK